MKLLIAQTESFIKETRGTVSADFASGSGVVVSMPSAVGFAVNDFVVVGTEGSETAELVQVTARTDTSITVTTRLAHKADEPVVKYRFDKRKFYGSLAAGGSYVELTGNGSPVPIGVDNPQGTVCEYTGIEGYLYFKSTYYNSQTTVESSLADANETLADESLRYCSLYAIRKQAGLTDNPFVTDGLVETYRKRAENEVKSYIMTRYTLPLQRADGTLETPAIIENATALLAAGYMDYQEFGSQGEGVKWLGEARGVLNSVKKGTQRLLDSNDQEMAYTSASNQIQGYPDCVDNSEGSTQQRQFTMGQLF